MEYLSVRLVHICVLDLERRHNEIVRPRFKASIVEVKENLSQFTAVLGIPILTACLNTCKRRQRMRMAFRPKACDLLLA